MVTTTTCCQKVAVLAKMDFTKPLFSKGFSQKTRFQKGFSQNPLFQKGFSQKTRFQKRVFRKSLFLVEKDVF
jgi:hypothetical protein